MSQASSRAQSGNVNFGEQKPNSWVIYVIIGAVILVGLWIVNRK